MLRKVYGGWIRRFPFLFWDQVSIVFLAFLLSWFIFQPLESVLFNFYVDSKLNFSTQGQSLQTSDLREGLTLLALSRRITLALSYLIAFGVFYNFLRDRIWRFFGWDSMTFSTSTIRATVIVFFCLLSFLTLAPIKVSSSSGYGFEFKRK